MTLDQRSKGKYKVIEAKSAESMEKKLNALESTHPFCSIVSFESVCAVQGNEEYEPEVWYTAVVRLVG